MCLCSEMSFIITVEPASMWPLPWWRQNQGNRADGWLAGVSAPLQSTTGILYPFVSINKGRRKTPVGGGAKEALLHVVPPLPTRRLLTNYHRTQAETCLMSFIACVYSLDFLIWSVHFYKKDIAKYKDGASGESTRHGPTHLSVNALHSILES